MLCQCRLAAAVVPEERDKAPLGDVQVEPVEDHVFGVLLLLLIAADQLVYANCLFFHKYFLCVQSFVQRPVLPHGRMSPVSRTGSPSSPHSVCPPCFFVTSVSMI